MSHNHTSNLKASTFTIWLSLILCVMLCYFWTSGEETWMRALVPPSLCSRVHLKIRIVKVMTHGASVRQDSLRQDSLKHRLSYHAPGFERSCTQNERKTHWGTSACPLASLRHEHRYVWARLVNTIYWKLLYLWKFRPIKIISGRISHIFSNLIFIR